jgi:hypothetical protein
MSTSLHVLIIEDSEDDTFLLRELGHCQGMGMLWLPFRAERRRQGMGIPGLLLRTGY